MALIPKSQREQWRARLTSLTQPLPWKAKRERHQGEDLFTLLDANGFWVADFGYSPECDVELAAVAPTAMEALLAENDELRRMVREALELAKVDRKTPEEWGRVRALVKEDIE